MLSQNILRRSLSFKAFIKHFEAPQRRVKIKTYVNFFSSSRIGTGRVNSLSESKTKAFENVHNLFSRSFIINLKQLFVQSDDITLMTS